jgi:hypothetical protein
MVRSIGGVVLAALVTAIAGCGGGDRVVNMSTRMILGGTQAVSGGNISTWAVVDPTSVVQQIGVTVPLAVIQNPPSPSGTAPVGVIAVVAFPDIVKSTTFFDHFELDWSPNGHAPARLMGVSHFDFQFYGISPQAVQQITPPDPTPPARDRIPEGYAYPGTDAAVPQEGVSALPIAESQSTQPFTETIAAGFYGGSMISVAPTIAPSVLMQRQDIGTMRSPRPVTIGRYTRAPNNFNATFDSASSSYQLVLSDFQTVIQ